MPAPFPRLVCCLLFLTLVPPTHAAEPATLAGTKPLTLNGDLASRMVDGIDTFLLRELAESVAKRKTFWKRDLSSPEGYNKSIEPNRQFLAHILGVRDVRITFTSPELIATLDEPALVGKGTNYEILAVRWPVLGKIHGEGLLLRPLKGKAVADVVAIPDADITPEQLCGLMPGVKAEAQYARRLAESGCRVLIPTLIDRTYEARNGRAKMTNREFIYRSAFEMGRHVIGYEVQKILAGVDWFAREGGEKAKIGVIGWGEGGMLALYAAALDPRIKATCISGNFGPRERIWEQPIDRNVFGLLEQFGDAELVSMIRPRRFVIDTTAGPELKLPSEGGAPAVLRSPDPKMAKQEFTRAIEGINEESGKKSDALVGDTTIAIARFLAILSAKPGASAELPEHFRKAFDPKIRQQRQLKELDRHNQALLAESPYVRANFMAKLDTTSKAKFEKGVESYREYFATQVIGRFDHKLLPANARTKKHSESDKWTIYQVVLDVFPDVIAYGLLVVPKDLKSGEKRPVVVCQHGLEGRPEDCIGEPGFAYYKAFATKLAERGFVTFAPQNPYIFKDRFRTLQRKANPLKKTLFSIIVPQHQQITDWLKTLSFVDGKRIGFYGLSYGGKSAMRIPPLVKNYALSICSADFNDWVWKNASSRSTYSYVWTGEYEIFEFDLGSTFNYSEMAALIAPRPFMVERGHFDGVAPDERVASEYAKIRYLYQAKLGIGDRTTIEWFVGPHTINGKGTYAFLHKHLAWPMPK